MHKGAISEILFRQMLTLLQYHHQLEDKSCLKVGLNLI